MKVEWIVVGSVAALALVVRLLYWLMKKPWDDGYDGDGFGINSGGDSDGD
jgi:hypothetical protein